MNAIANKRLQQLELDIESGVRSIGKALTEIHNTKAYLDGYDSFEHYCKTRWNFTDRYARNLIEAESVRTKIGTIVPVDSLKTQALLAISKVPAAKQAQVAAAVIEACEAENRAPTAKDCQEAAKPYIKPKAEPKEEKWVDVEDAETVSDDKHSSVKSNPKALSAPIQAVATQIAGIVKQLHKLSDDDGGEWLDMTDIETKAQALRNSIRSAVYWVDCPDCEGKGCNTCKRHGWLSIDRKNFLTQNQKDKLGV